MKNSTNISLLAITLIVGAAAFNHYVVESHKVSPTPVVVAVEEPKFMSYAKTLPLREKITLSRKLADCSAFSYFLSESNMFEEKKSKLVGELAESLLVMSSELYDPAVARFHHEQTLVVMAKIFRDSNEDVMKATSVILNTYTPMCKDLLDTIDE